MTTCTSLQQVEAVHVWFWPKIFCILWHSWPMQQLNLCMQCINKCSLSIEYFYACKIACKTVLLFYYSALARTSRICCKYNELFLLSICMQTSNNVYTFTLQFFVVSEVDFNFVQSSLKLFLMLIIGVHRINSFWALFTLCWMSIIFRGLLMFEAQSPPPDEEGLYAPYWRAY